MKNIFFKYGYGRKISAVTAALCAALIIIVIFPEAAVFAAGSQETAKNTSYDITDSCVITASAGHSGFTPDCGALRDGDTSTYMRLPESGALFWKCTLRNGRAQGVYIQWEYVPGEWRFEARGADDGVICEEICGTKGFLQEYIPLPEGTMSFYIHQLEKSGQLLSISEMSVWSKGELPQRVHDWDPTPTKCELMVISTHQDDELLFFGGTIPYYAGENKLDTVVVYMADCGTLRLHEALNGLWVCGLRQYPVFLMLPDKKSYTIGGARFTWNDAEVTETVAKLFLTYQPQVVVTHDVDGEYGHGQHMLTAYCVQQALELSADSYSAYRLIFGSEPYDVPKCYLHLWNEDKLRMKWDRIELKSMGMTAAEAASAGYAEHASQHKWYKDIFIGDEYDCRDYGLYRTSVGKDRRHRDMFENIEPRIENPVRIPAPPEDWFVPCTHSGYVFSGVMRDGGEIGETVYIRYGSAGGAEDWYRCDETGTLITEGGKAVRYEKKTEIVQVIEQVSENAVPPYVSLWDKVRRSRLFAMVKEDTGLDDNWTGLFLGGGLLSLAAALIIVMSFISEKRRKTGRRRARRGGRAAGRGRR